MAKPQKAYHIYPTGTGTHEFFVASPLTDEELLAIPGINKVERGIGDEARIWISYRYNGAEVLDELKALAEAKWKNDA